MSEASNPLKLKLHLKKKSRRKRRNVTSNIDNDDSEFLKKSVDEDVDEQESEQTSYANEQVVEEKNDEVESTEDVSKPENTNIEIPKLSPDELYKKLITIHRSIQKRDSRKFFWWPVTDVIAPGYSRIVKTPMDLHTMNRKISNRDYPSVQEYFDDLVLVITNCMLYNLPDTSYYKMAVKLLNFAEKLFSKEFGRPVKVDTPPPRTDAILLSDLLKDVEETDRHVVQDESCASANDTDQKESSESLDQLPCEDEGITNVSETLEEKMETNEAVESNVETPFAESALEEKVSSSPNNELTTESSLFEEPLKADISDQVTEIAEVIKIDDFQDKVLEKTVLIQADDLIVANQNTSLSVAVLSEAESPPRKRKLSSSSFDDSPPQKKLLSPVLYDKCTPSPSPPSLPLSPESSEELDSSKNLQFKTLANLGYIELKEPGSAMLCIVTPADGTRLPLAPDVLTVDNRVDDSQNNWKPYEYLHYGPFATHAPYYDGSASGGFSREESDLLMSTYGGAMGAQLARSVMNFTNDLSEDGPMRKYVDDFLDNLTDGRHSEITEDEFTSLFSLESKGIDVGFLKCLQKDIQLSQSADLIEQLSASQNERLSANCFSTDPTSEETEMANTVLGNLTALASSATPGDLLSVH